MERAPPSKLHYTQNEHSFTKKTKTMKTMIYKICVLALLPFLILVGCKEKEIPDETRKAQDYIGKYSGYVIRERMAPDGWVVHKNAFVEGYPDRGGNNTIGSRRQFPDGTCVGLQRFNSM